MLTGRNIISLQLVGPHDFHEAQVSDADKVYAADLDINAAGFSWDQATRTGSRGIVVWSSSNLVDWSEPSLKT